MINDSQHRHTVEPQTTDIEIIDGEDVLEALAAHLVYKECPSAPVLTGKTHIPMNFTVEVPGSKTATLVCGFCQKKMGTCKINYPGAE